MVSSLVILFVGAAYADEQTKMGVKYFLQIRLLFTTMESEKLWFVKQSLSINFTV